MDQNNSAQRTYSDEIDLFDLFAELRKSKLLILLITVLFTTLGIAYSLLSTPVYESTAIVAPPSPNSLIEIQKAQTILKEAGQTPKVITPQSIFGEYITRLNSNRYKNSFLERPDLQEYFRAGNTSQLKSREQFRQALKISTAIKPPYSQATLSLQTHSDKLSSQWLNEYIEYAHTRFVQELSNNIQNEITATKNNLKLTIQSIKENYLVTLKEDIINLEEALVVAKEIGLIEPLKTETTFYKEQSVDQLRALYHLGSKSLSAELKALKKRLKKSSIPHGLSKEKFKLKLLSNINIHYKSIAAQTIDLAAEPNLTPIKPKGLIVTALSTLLGFILGIAITLIKHSLNNRKKSV